MSASGSEDGTVADSLCRLQRLVCRHAEAVTELAAELTAAHAHIVEIATPGAPLDPLAGTGSTTRNERLRRAARPESLGAGEKSAAGPAPTKAGSNDSGRFGHVVGAVRSASFLLPAVPHEAAECEDVVNDLLDATSEPVRKYGRDAPRSETVQDFSADPLEWTARCGRSAGTDAAPSKEARSPSKERWSRVRATARSKMWSKMEEEFKLESSSPGIFADPEALKEAIRETLTEDPFDLASCYHRTGCSQAVARSRAFEVASLAMVCLSSLWIGVEVDLDGSVGLFDAHPAFQVTAQVFCAFFVAELLVRFLAFRDKADVRKDPWFLFDALLAALVVFETWVMSTAVALMSADGAAAENLRVLAVFRTFRVLRVLRLARVVRQLSELMVIVRGIGIALRGIATVIGLLSVIIYLGAVVFRVLLEDTGVGQEHFSSIPSALGTLLLELTLSGGRGVAIIRQAYGEHFAYAFLLLCFVVFANVTLMGVLSGLLVQTVRAVAEIEKEERSVRSMQSTMNCLWDLITSHDANHDGMIGMQELQAILLDRDIARVLQRMGVDLDGLGSVAHFVFEENDGALTKGQFKRMVLDLRNSQAAKVKDHVETRKYVCAQFKKRRLRRRSSTASTTVSTAASGTRDTGNARAWEDVLALAAPGPH